MNLTIILIIAVVLLILIGATQRKRLLLIFRSEVNAITKEAVTNIKVLDLRLTELKEAIKNTIEAAGSLFAQIKKTEADIIKMEADIKAYNSEAKTAKDTGEIEVSKAKIEAAIYTQKTLDKAKLDIIELNKRKIKLEVSITRMKLKKNAYSNEIELLRGRDSVNKALKSVAGYGNLGGEPLGEAIETMDNKISFEENKFGYIDGTQTEDFTSEVEDSYNKL